MRGGVEDIDMVEVAVPEKFDRDQNLKVAGAPKPVGGPRSASQAVEHRLNPIITDVNQMEVSDSINITKEALEIGKLPPEHIALKIARSGYRLSADDP